jgi:hypothetical protein
MASYAYTFSSGDTVTPTRLNDARTVSNIVNADISSTAAIAGTKLADGGITDSKINASAAIALSKLASIPAGQVLLGNASNVPTATALSGDVTISNTGVTAIGSGVIVNADISATAAIAGTKVSPNFGTQNITTTGQVLANAGTSTSPGYSFTGDTNTGFTRPTTDSIALVEGGVERMRLTNTGRVGIGTTSPAYHLDVNGDANVTGVLRVDATQVVTNRRTGWAAPTGPATRTTFATSSVTTAQLAERVHALIDDLTAHGLIGS